MFRSITKKVGEYKKLTGQYPGVWRTAAETKVQSKSVSDTWFNLNLSPV